MSKDKGEISLDKGGVLQTDFNDWMESAKTRMPILINRDIKEMRKEKNREVKRLQKLIVDARQEVKGRIDQLELQKRNLKLKTEVEYKAEFDRHVISLKKWREKCIKEGDN